MVENENEAGLSEAEESRDNPSSEATPKGVTAPFDSDQVHSSASLNKSSSRKRPRLDLPAESTAREDTRCTSSNEDTSISVNTTEANVPVAPKPPSARGSSDRTKECPNPKSTTAKPNLIDPFPNSDPLTSLPLELLGEILIHTRSTKDILRVARCSKHFWRTLTAPSATFIWKNTRLVTLPKPMPDPPGVLSECAYASMVFDGSRCEICLNHTNEMYYSFALKLRVCRNKSCQAFDPIYHGFIELQIDRNPDSVIWERTPIAGASSPMAYERWPRDGLWCRSTERKKVSIAYRREFKATGDHDEFQRKHQDAIEKNQEWMEFCITLSEWKDAYMECYINHKRRSAVVARIIAKEKGYTLPDLLNETSYGALHHIRNRYFQNIARNDFIPLEPKVKEEMHALGERRKRAQREASYRTIYNAIQKYHNKLRNNMQPSDPVVPPFSTFRRLPVFASLLNLADMDTSKSIQDILKRSSVSDVVKTEMMKWETEARKKLTEILGCPERDSRPESEGEPHPVDSWTAWFLCKHCAARAIELNTAIQPLCFREACQHECPVPKGQGRGDGLWDALNFTKDEKAISALEKCASPHEYNPQSSPLIKCLSCQPYAILTIKDVVFHCHRHNDMEMDRMRIDDLELLRLISRYGLATPGLAKNLVARTNAERYLKDCGCRSCLLEAAQNHPDVNHKELLAEQHRMSIHGLRSHLKAKHGIHILRDEDVFNFPIDDALQVV